MNNPNQTNSVAQMLQMLMLMQQLGQPDTSKADAEPCVREGNVLKFRRTVNVFVRKDGSRVVALGDIVCPWTGAARAIKASACQKVQSRDGTEYLRTKNEWDVSVSVSPFGRMRIVKAVDTGDEYVGGDDFDDSPESDGFDDAPVTDDGKGTL